MATCEKWENPYKAQLEMFTKEFYPVTNLIIQKLFDEWEKQATYNYY